MVKDSVCTKFQVYRFLFDLETWPKYINKYIHTYTSEMRNIFDRLLASHGFWNVVRTQTYKMAVSR